jgi:hypothetical protein
LVRARTSDIAGWREGVGSSAHVSERFPVCDAKDVIRVLRKHGFSRVSQKGTIKNGVTQVVGK